MQTIQLYL